MKIRTIFLSAIILVAAGYVIVNNIALYFYDLALNPKVSKASVFASDINQPSPQFKEKSAADKVLEERLVSESHIITMTAFDNLTLKAYELKTSTYSNKWAIIAHGYGQDPIKMGKFAYAFYNKGYNVLVPHLRGHGLSEGDYIAMGYHDGFDVADWSRYIAKTDTESEIVLFGISMGAAAVMVAGGENLPANVKVIIEDCGYTSAWDEFAYQLKSLYGLPPFPLMDIVNSIVKKRAGYDLHEASPLEALKNLKIPIMFIQGTKDTFVPFHMLDTLFNAANVEKTKFIVEGAGHGEASKLDPDNYWHNVFIFIDKYI